MTCGWSCEAAILDSPGSDPGTLVLGELGGDDLERDLATESLFVGPVDRAHPASADQRLDAVAGELASDQALRAPPRAHP